MIRIIIEVIKEMRFFLLIMLLIIFAFGNSLLQLSAANEDEKDRFISGGILGGANYVYQMILGSASTDFGNVGVPFCWILFLICSVLNMIIMINLLIAIISEAFARVNSVSV